MTPDLARQRAIEAVKSLYGASSSEEFPTYVLQSRKQAIDSLTQVLLTTAREATAREQARNAQAHEAIQSAMKVCESVMAAFGYAPTVDREVRDAYLRVKGFLALRHPKGPVG